jgi:tetratricopeptide (TPR) repeat protein
MKRNRKYAPETREVEWSIYPGQTAIVQVELDGTTILIRESWVNKFLEGVAGEWPFGKDEAAIALAAKLAEFSRPKREVFLRELRNECKVRHIKSGLDVFKAEEREEYSPEWDIPCYFVFLPDPDRDEPPEHQKHSVRSSIESVRRENYPILNRAVETVLEGGNTTEARRLAQQALDNFRKVGDRQGEADSLHYQGRIEHELGNLDEAMYLYEQALEIARFVNYQEAITRAMHERARIFFRRDRDLIKAEEGFRYALHYYASQADEPNLQVAINGLGALAEDALSMSEFYLPTLERDGVPYGTPEEFLYIRAIAIRAEIGTMGHRYREHLVEWAEKVLQKDPRFAEYILCEAKRTAELCGDHSVLRAIGKLHRRLE